MEFAMLGARRHKPGTGGARHCNESLRLRLATTTSSTTTGDGRLRRPLRSMPGMPPHSTGSAWQSKWSGTRWRARRPLPQQNRSIPRSPMTTGSTACRRLDLEASAAHPMRHEAKEKVMTRTLATILASLTLGLAPARAPPVRRTASGSRTPAHAPCPRPSPILAARPTPSKLGARPPPTRSSCMKRRGKTAS